MSLKNFLPIFDHGNSFWFFFLSPPTTRYNYKLAEDLDSINVCPASLSLLLLLISEHHAWLDWVGRKQ